MSIYGGRKSWKDFTDLHRRVPGGGPAIEFDTAPDDHGGEWAARRRAQPAEFILPVTRAWLAGLPAATRPAALVAIYPRIVNMIAAQWHNRRECPSLFEDLLVDRRGGRAGFPPPARRDLLKLQEYWYNGRASA